MTDRAATFALAERAAAEAGGLSIWINGAGIVRVAKVLDADPEDWQQILAVNLTGTFHGCAAALAVMSRQGFGRIVNIGSLSGQVGGTGVHPAYGASKAGVHALTKSYALEGARYGVYCNAVAPSVIEGAMGDQFSERQRAQLAQSQPAAPARPHGRGGRRDPLSGERCRELHQRRDPAGQRRLLSVGKPGVAMGALDPVTLAVIQSGLVQVCNEMDLAFCRAAFSPVISEAMDRSDGIYGRDGALIAQGDLGLPVFVGTMQFSTQAVIERVPEVRPGDVIIVNDPYLGGTHLMDVRFTKPFFYRGELFAWLANTGHWPDTGGAVPGGFSANATEVEQEGLRLPPVKLYKEGRLDQEILAIILSNIRIADQRIGDIKAQAAALTVGEKRLTALLDRYGRALVEDAIAELRARAAQQMRARIAEIPDGVWPGEAFVDSDGVDDQPLRIAMTITKRGDDAAFRHVGLEPALPRADEQRARDHQVRDLPRDQAHLPRGADQCRHLRAAADRGSGRHLPLCEVSAAGLGLRRGGEPADRRGGLQRAGAGDPAPAVRSARRHLAATSRSAASTRTPGAAMCSTSSRAAAMAARRRAMA